MTTSNRACARSRRSAVPVALPRAPHVTVRQAARLIGVHENTLRKWEAQGLIKAVHLPGSGYRRIPESEVARIRADMWKDVPIPEDPGYGARFAGGTSDDGVDPDVS
jgi:excisionase family DNA binding protein